MNLSMPREYQGELLLDEPLAAYTTWRVGGKAKQLYKPVNIEDLSFFLQKLSKQEPILWLGLGSNSLIRDKGFAGTVVLTQGCLKAIQQVGDEHVRVEAGVSCATMARFCARAHLAGGEFWAGIPGTMGGALRMNAGCFGHETWEFVEQVETMTRDGVIHKRLPHEFAISYRHVLGPKDEWFVAATCRMQKGNKETALESIKKLLAHRADTQPINEANCGSVFRNPPGRFAAQLIESCGLKGTQIGGAMVSLKHANFIINHQNRASAQDIELLIKLIQDTVQQHTNIELIREIHVIGEQ